MVFAALDHRLWAATPAGWKSGPKPRGFCVGWRPHSFGSLARTVTIRSSDASCDWYETMQLRHSPDRRSYPHTRSPERIDSIGRGPSGVKTSVPAGKRAWMAQECSASKTSRRSSTGEGGDAGAGETSEVSEDFGSLSLAGVFSAFSQFPCTVFVTHVVILRCVVTSPVANARLHHGASVVARFSSAGSSA